MNIKQLKTKLENVEYEVVYAIWIEHCQPELPELWQMIAEIIDCANHDDDVFETVENTLSNPQANGFHNTPAECESRECSECEAPDGAKRDIDCPYVN